MAEPVEPTGRLPPKLRSGLLLLAAALLFIFSIQLLRGSVGTLAPWLRIHLQRLVTGEASTLGFAWLASYLLMNGSVVAALALTFLEQQVIDGSQVLMMIGGSRLGAAGVVVAVGAVDYFNQRKLSLGRACSMGILSFLITHAQSIPALAASWLWTEFVPLSLSGLFGIDDRRISMPPTLDTLSDGLIKTVGPTIGFLAGLLLLYFALRLLNKGFAGVDIDRIRRKYFSFLRNRWLSFGLGLLVTGLTLSVAFSLAIVVPLYNRGLADEREVLPYIMGANIGTFGDTIIIAFLLEPAAGVDATLAFIGATLLVTLFFLVAFRRLLSWNRRLIEAIASSDRRFLLFLASLAIVPALLLAL